MTRAITPPAPETLSDDALDDVIGGGSGARLTGRRQHKPFSATKAPYIGETEKNLTAPAKVVAEGGGSDI